MQASEINIDTSDDGFDCNICLDKVSQPVVTRCGHLFCWPCIYEWMQVGERKNDCPVCNTPCVSEKSLIPLYTRGSNNDDQQQRNSPGSGSSIPSRPNVQARQEIEPNNFDYSTLGEEGIQILSDSEGLRNFLLSPIPRGAGTLQCDIKRVRRGANRPREYYVYLKVPLEEDLLIMFTKYERKRQCSLYQLRMGAAGEATVDPRFEGEDANPVVAKLHANYVGTSFYLDDCGLTLQDFAQTHQSQSVLRRNLAAMIYESNFFGRKGPRKMKIGIPLVTEEGEEIVWRPQSRDQEILPQYASGNKRNIWSFKNKPPIWAENIGAYVLNFDRRVSQASVKNFQLISEMDHTENFLQFGRFGRDLFSMDFTWPLSPVQAFGISLSSLDKKIACD